MSATLAFLDVESTGLSPWQNQVWEVGLILRDAEGHDTEHLWQLPVDLSRADARALSVGKFYERRWPPIKPHVGLPTPSPIYGHPGLSEFVQPDLTAWVQHFAKLTHETHLVGANPAFDQSFLIPLLRNNGACPGWSYHLIDIEALALGWLNAKGGSVTRPHSEWVPQPPWKSNDLSIAVGVDPGDFERHSALGDCQWVKALFDKIMGSHEKV